jgi:hypothetical protein
MSAADRAALRVCGMLEGVFRRRSAAAPPFLAFVSVGLRASLSHSISWMRRA